MSETQNENTNSVTVEQADFLTPDYLATLPIENLFALQNAVAARKKKIAEIDSKLDAAILAKFGEDHTKERRRQNKDTGSVSLLYPPFTLKVDISKKVEWDQFKLRDAYVSLKKIGHDPDDYMDYAIIIPEAKYAKLPDKVKQILSECRTIKAGKPSPQLILNENEE